MAQTILVTEDDGCMFIEESGFFGFEDYYRMLLVSEKGDCLTECKEDKYCTAASYSDLPFGQRCLLYTKRKKMYRVKDSLSTLWTRMCKTGERFMKDSLGGWFSCSDFTGVLAVVTNCPGFYR